MFATVVVTDVGPQGNTRAREMKRTREIEGNGRRCNLARDSFFLRVLRVVRFVVFSSILPSFARQHGGSFRVISPTSSRETEMENAVTMIFKLRDVRRCLRATRKIMRWRGGKFAAFTVTRALPKSPPRNLR